jgi:hypothetical protein
MSYRFEESFRAGPGSIFILACNSYMFRAVPLPIIRSLFTVHSAVVYVIQVCRQLSSSSILVLLESSLQTAWHIPLLSVLWINSWWWAEELSETCRVLCRSKFGKLVHLVGFIIRWFVTTHSHVNVKLFCHVCPTVWLHVSLRLPLNEFPSNLILETFMKICRGIWNFF